MPIVAHAQDADPSAVVWDAMDAAAARGTDVVVVDTAGRLHTRSNLMDELAKIRRTIGKRLPAAQPEVLFVLDATTGQNGLVQAKAFHEAAGLTGIALTKLDSTSKGGIAFAIERAWGCRCCSWASASGWTTCSTSTPTRSSGPSSPDRLSGSWTIQPLDRDQLRQAARELADRDPILRSIHRGTRRSAPVGPGTRLCHAGLDRARSAGVAGIGHRRLRAPASGCGGA